MSTTAGSSRLPLGTRGWAWLRTHPYTVLAVVVLAGFGVSFQLRHESEWDSVFVRAAGQLLVGEDLYNEHSAYLYPPAMAFFTIPFAVLPHWAMRGGWFLVSILCLVLMVGWAWKLSGGARLEGEMPANRREHLIWWLGLACGVRFMLNCLDHQQNDLLVGALILGGCLALTRTRYWLGATSLGVAAAIKCTPLLWCPYLVWRGRWRPAVWLLCVAVGVNLLPDLVSRPQPNQVWVARWGARYIAPMSSQTYYPGQWGSEIIYNQSLSGAANRLLTTTWGRIAGQMEVVTRPHPISPRAVKAVVYGGELLLLLGVALALGRRPYQVSPRERPPSAEVLEYSVVLLLMLLLSPMSSKAHFGIILLPAFCVARLAVREGNRVCWALLVAAVVIGASSLESLWGKTLGFYSLWSGSVTWSVVLLLLGCAYWLWRRRSAGLAQPPS